MNGSLKCAWAAGIDISDRRSYLRTSKPSPATRPAAPPRAKSRSRKKSRRCRRTSAQRQIPGGRAGIDGRGKTRAEFARSAQSARLRLRANEATRYRRSTIPRSHPPGSEIRARARQSGKSFSAARKVGASAQRARARHQTRSQQRARSLQSRHGARAAKGIFRRRGPIRYRAKSAAERSSITFLYFRAALKANRFPEALAATDELVNDRSAKFRSALQSGNRAGGRSAIRARRRSFLARESVAPKHS